MLDIASFTKEIFEVRQQGFDALAMRVFKYQAEHNPVYKRYLSLLDRDPDAIVRREDIPFLPISAFRHYKVISGETEAALIFESSGTTGAMVSRHYVCDPSVYHESLLRGFTLRYGAPENYCILALLPGYLERKNASLVYMCRELINRSEHQESGFYLQQHDKLLSVIKHMQEVNVPVLLIGVSFALLDLLPELDFHPKEMIVMETGGMKGRREEITREDLHEKLCSGFGLQQIHSEYGMTELLSQAYATRKGVFIPPPWMRIVTRAIDDPFAQAGSGVTGGINVIDLANVHSCSFIATDDIGVCNADGSFTVAGRLDNSDIRGCNLMVD